MRARSMSRWLLLYMSTAWSTPSFVALKAIEMVNGGRSVRRLQFSLLLELLELVIEPEYPSALTPAEQLGQDGNEKDRDGQRPPIQASV